jgi:glucose/arabinose dehydrogenase
MGESGCDEIWALGLRNPWRIAIDHLTGDMFIADVGEWQREEINYLPGGSPGGKNFGWHCWEGSFDYSQVHPLIANSCKVQREYTFPVYEYDHSQGECSVIGGLVYRGQRYPRLYGRYFFGDFCSGRLWTMAREGGQWKVESAGDANLPFSTFGEDMHGELYAGIFMSGTLFKVSVR